MVTPQTIPQTILVTGASRGIGLLTAKALAQRGHTVFASMRNISGRNRDAASRIQTWASETGFTVKPIELDVTDQSSVDQAVAAILAEGELDVLVNNAGFMPVGVTEAFTPEQQQACFDVNMFGLARTSRAVLPHMRERGSGLLVNLSSSAGRLTIPHFGLYCASKWAMEAYCEALHYELEPFGIDSVLVEPSGHGTDLVSSSPAPADASTVEAYGPFGGGRERLLGMFQDMFEQGDAITNAGNVARKIVELVEMEGPRPIRTQVGQDMGVEAVNDATAPIQAGLVEGLKPVYLPETVAS